jgi:uncharacterized repeat protein (TIGR02543 family)
MEQLKKSALLVIVCVTVIALLSATPVAVATTTNTVAIYMLTVHASIGGYAEGSGGSSTVYASNGGTSEVSVSPGTLFTLDATPYSGYTFQGWTCSGNGCYAGTDSHITITINNDVTENANFALVIPENVLPLIFLGLLVPVYMKRKTLRSKISHHTAN